MHDNSQDLQNGQILIWTMPSSLRVCVTVGADRSAAAGQAGDRRAGGVWGPGASIPMPRTTHSPLPLSSLPQAELLQGPRPISKWVRVARIRSVAAGQAGDMSRWREGGVQPARTRGRPSTRLR
jgi:hypothetical protein